MIVRSKLDALRDGMNLARYKPMAVTPQLKQYAANRATNGGGLRTSLKRHADATSFATNSFAATVDRALRSLSGTCVVAERTLRQSIPGVRLMMLDADCSSEPLARRVALCLSKS